MEGRVKKKATTPAKRKPAKPVKKAKAKAKTTYDVMRDSSGRGYFYFRSEPNTRMVRGVDVKFSYDDLVCEPGSTAHWDGVRNHVAKNWMRAMKLGDRALFYHSNAADETGVVGTVEIVREAYPDHTAWDKCDPHFDGRSTKESPTWHMVDVKSVAKFHSPVMRPALKEHPVLKDMYMIKQGRISVGPVTPDEWNQVLQLAGEDSNIGKEELALPVKDMDTTNDVKKDEHVKPEAETTT